MVITVIPMLSMKTSINNIVYMIPVSHSLMSTVRIMSMFVKMSFITFIRMIIIYF